MNIRSMTKDYEKLPGLYDTEDIKVDDKVLGIKFFNPCGFGSWYAVEYDKKERVFFGYVSLIEKEWGYFSLDELADVELPFDIKIERDMHFTPCKFSELEIL